MRFIHYTYPSARGVAATFGDRFSRSGFAGEFDNLFETALTGLSGSAQFPVDLYEDKENTYVRAELPGVTRDAIGVEIVDGALSIQASRKDGLGEAAKTQALSRLVSIPDEVQADKVSASYVNGILTVTLPRKEEAKARKINVSVN